MNRSSYTNNNNSVFSPSWKYGSSSSSDMASDLINDLFSSASTSLGINEEQRRLTEIALDIQYYYPIVLVVIGVPSNLLTIITILSMHALSPATFFVALLAAFDGCALVVKLIGNQIVLHRMNTEPWFCNFLDPLSVWFSTTANWVLVLICAERFISVCYPLKKVYLFTKRRSFLSAAVLAATLFILLMTIIGVMREAKSTGCVTRLEYSWFWINVWYYINTGLHLFIPFILIIILTGFVIYGLRQSRKHRMSLIRRSDEGDENQSEEMKVLRESGAQGDGRPRSGIFSSGAKKVNRSTSVPSTPTAMHNRKLMEDTARVERTITIMLIAAALIFLLLSLPMSVFYLCQNAYMATDSRSVERARWELYKNIAYLLVDSSHAVNFFLYFFTAKRFRAQLFRVVTGKFSCFGRRLINAKNGGNSSNRSNKGVNGNNDRYVNFGSRQSLSATASTSLSSNVPRQSTVYIPGSGGGGAENEAAKQ